MKKFGLLLLVAVCFFGSAVLGAVKIKPKAENQVLVQKYYSAEETAAANLVKKANVINGLNDSSLIFPDQTLIYPFPKDDDRWFYNVRKGDQQLKIAKQLLFGNFKMLPIDTSWTEFKPQKEGLPVLPTTNEVKSYLNWCWALLFLLVIALFALGYVLWESTIVKKQHEEELKWQKKKEDLLAKELEKTINKLPIIAPPVVNEYWLKNNNPVGSGNNIQNLTFSGIKEYGKMPDLIAQVVVSTAPNAVKMAFSHDRTAISGLNSVKVYLGWNWDNLKKEWVPVGMIASVCSNGFQVSPEKVKPIRDLFTEFELVSSDKHPVVYIASDALPNGDSKYPVLIRGLIMKYHAEHIADINRAGAVVVPKNNNEEKKN